MNLVAVVSSNLEAVGYDAQARTLRILFQSGSTYEYANVPAEVHADLMAASSKNEYFTDNIKYVFSYKKV
jgi:hypothetical protein